MRLNLGSGNTKLDGFISVDLYDKEADVRADIAELPFDSESVDEIVCYQVIEHIPYQKSQQLFDEMYRVLKPGCRAILETPDIAVVARKILEEGLTDNLMYNLVGEYYRPWDKDRYDDWEMNAASIHRNPWTLERLVKYGFVAGFSQINRRVPDYYAEFEETMSVELVK